MDLKNRLFILGFYIPWLTRVYDAYFLAFFHENTSQRTLSGKRILKIIIGYDRPFFRERMGTTMKIRKYAPHDLGVCAIIDQLDRCGFDEKHMSFSFLYF